MSLHYLEHTSNYNYNFIELFILRKEEEIIDPDEVHINMDKPVTIPHFENPYLYIKAWGILTGVSTESQVAQAVEDHAPATAIYRYEDGRWACASNISHPRMRKIVDDLVDVLKAKELNVKIQTAAEKETQEHTKPCPYNKEVMCVRYPGDSCGECSIKLKAKGKS